MRLAANPAGGLRLAVACPGFPAFADAFLDGTTIFPQSVLFFLKANDGAYRANLVYARLNYAW